jgi:transcriptional regulator with GAF, ATPase, and Fis domain
VVIKLTEGHWFRVASSKHGFHRRGSCNGGAILRCQLRMNNERERCWLAAYTRSRHENHVADQLATKGVEALLPTYERFARWSDRIRRSHAPPFPGYVFIHVSHAERVLVLQTRRVAGRESPILLQGETGSGKGVLANWIHRNGWRAKERFLDLNCAGFSRELLESELFGHVKGVFTSAMNAKQGLLEGANRGTVFLDEVGDIDLQIQPKLLKVLENKVFRRVGDVNDRSVDIRLISATHRDLMELVRQQKFRSDLYFRVNIVPLRIPSLRERVEDIPILTRYFLDRLAQDCGRGEMTLETSAMEALQQYSWPGNIRELRKVLERAVLLTERNQLSVHHLQLQNPTLMAHPLARATGTLKQVERAYIHLVLQDEGGCVERTARRLGIARSSLYNKLKRYNIPTPSDRA